MLAGALAGCAGTPPTAQRVTAPAAAQISGSWVEIKRGDTLGQLAKRANVPLERLQRFNPGVKARHLIVGQRLLLPTQQERAPASGPYRYQIRPGDTFSSLARHFGTTPSRLQSANTGSSATSLRVGELINIPVGSSSNTSRTASSGAPAKQPAASTASSNDTTPPASAKQWPWPLEDYRVVRRFGPDSRGTLQPMLLATQANAHATAVASGEVRFAGSMRQLDKVVIVHHADNIQSVYALCGELTVEEGQQVSTGDHLCQVGKSRASERYDLLFDLRKGGKPIDPRQVLK
ncbi:MAG: Membrane-bound metallopeptidase [Halomonas sp. HL-48]|nr:M23 family metallopeptidase [Halomonas sp. HL-48]KPQ24115.1 MAG: Membrane-bound metallopeptidase [Halomonas sp. HL-48]